MAYATYTDYTTWLSGRTAKIVATDFPFYANKATRLMDKITVGKTKESLTVLDEMKNCCCELAEMLLAEESRNRNVKSENNDGYSVTYDETQTVDSRAKDICLEYLLDTGLLYKGGILQC